MEKRRSNNLRHSPYGHRPVEDTERIYLRWDYCLEDVWWPRARQQQKRRGSGDDTEEDLCRTVPAEYYSRHQMLRTESPNYILPPSSQNPKGAPVYTYRPGTSSQVQKFWPSRAHDGTMEQKSPPKQQDATSPSENDGKAK
ncbi:uncharacterized protein TNCT_19801 [Trichonephila clavata]|uniref:Uncharacterized protein n=1 Tax=Trichonephila clavata TaxID=2740835 RepID=A0A8X6IDM0_TRICU|nr:uncharacterized protein TNCT_19801 [Trichonephila clavata]